MAKLNTTTFKLTDQHNKDILFNYYKNKHNININEIIKNFNNNNNTNITNYIDTNKIYNIIQYKIEYHIKKIINNTLYHHKFTGYRNKYITNYKDTFNNSYILHQCSNDPNMKYIYLDNRIYVYKQNSPQSDPQNIQVQEIISYRGITGHFFNLLENIFVHTVGLIPIIGSFVIMGFGDPTPRYIKVKQIDVYNNNLKKKIKNLIDNDLELVVYDINHKISNDIKNLNNPRYKIEFEKMLYDYFQYYCSQNNIEKMPVNNQNNIEKMHINNWIIYIKKILKF